MTKTYYLAHRPEILEKKKARYYLNPSRFVRESAEWGKHNPERRKLHRLNWVIRNPEKAKECSRRWEDNNKEKRNAYSKEWAKRNPDKARERGERFHQKHYIPHPRILQTREIKLAKKRAWYQKNRLKICEGDKLRRITDFSWRMKKTLSARLRIAIKRGEGLKPRDSSLSFLGCSIKQFLNYIESKFKFGMTWENYGKYGWHIDHIMPCSSFDLTQPEQIAKCFHYTNLQPLWASENMHKSDSLLWIAN